MKSKIMILGISIILSSFSLTGQEEDQKFGKISKEEIDMAYYEKDSTANALILFDKGRTYFQYDNGDERFKMFFEKQIRIKFFKKEGYEFANFKIPLYKSAGSNLSEGVISLKGITYNNEKGSIEKQKIDKSEIIIEETSENWDHATFSFPGVKEGSVIDLRYTIESPFFFNMHQWRFQYEIPVQYSEYSVLIPEFYKYHKNMRGYDFIKIDEEIGNHNETFSIEYKSLPQKGGVIEKGTYVLESNSMYTKWTAHEIPAFELESYVTTYEDYVSILEFELISVEYPGQIRNVYTNDWNSVNKHFEESEAFGKQLKVSKLIESTADELTLGLTDKKEMMHKLYNYVQNEIKWNKKISKYIELPRNYSYTGQYSRSYLEHIIENKSGNSAEINLLLMMLLRSKQILCNPIILSTRDNGKIFPTHPTISRFNYVIAEVIIGDEYYYLDATSKKTPLGLLPQRCLNGVGRRVISGALEEVKIEPEYDYGLTKVYNLSIDEDSIMGTVNNVYKGYAALDIHDEIDDAGNIDTYIKEKISGSTQVQIQNIKVEGIENNNDPIKESYEMKTGDDITFTGEMIYLKPLLHESIKENPFKIEERKYPVDYSYKINEKYIMQYTIPEGYEVIELPENLNMVLPEKAAGFQYQVSQSGNVLQILSHFKINMPMIQYDLYPSLKNFYNLVIEKQNENIVFKKKS